MQYIPALLLLLVHLCTMSSSLPVYKEGKMKSKVKSMAEQLVIKMNKTEIPPSLMTYPPSEEHYGQSSVVMILNGYNELISESLSGAPQVKSEMYSLTHFIQSRAGHCTDRPKPLLPLALTELQGQKPMYVVTISYTALYRSMEYLRNLVQNLSQLETCS